MHDVAAAVREVEYALDTLHLDGVVLLSAYDGVYLGDPRFEPLMRALGARSAHVFVHPAATPSTPPGRRRCSSPFSETFDAADRMQIERTNALRELPQLASAVQ